MGKTLLSLIFLLMASLAHATPDTLLYDGKTVADSQISVSNWGGGTGQESTDLFLNSGHSLKITTLDFYQGARISFQTPVPIPSGGAGLILQISLRRGSPTLHYDPSALSGTGTNPASLPTNTAPPNRRRRRRPFTGTTDVPATTTVSIPQITRLRLLFTLADGRQADLLGTIPDSADLTFGSGWYTVSLPLTGLKLPATASIALRSLTIGGDQYGVFYIGRIKLAIDPTPLDIGANVETLPFGLSADNSINVNRRRKS